MKTMTRRFGLALAVMAGVLAFAFPADARPSTPCDGVAHRLNRKGAFGQIAVHPGKKVIPADAEVSVERVRPDDAKRKIHKGWSTRKECGKGAASPKRARRLGSGTSAASPSVLASYDIAIKSGGRKWQPDAGDPVRVDVELDAPVPVIDASSLGVVHLADDGTVEELPESRYGFTYNKEKTAVTAFWFSAEGFSVYAITEGAVHTTDSDPARRLYDFYSLDFNKFLEDGVTSNTTYNTYVPRYFKTLEGNYTFRQIVTNNQFLVRPEALPSPLGRTFMGWYLYSTNNANKTVDGVTYDADGYATTPFDFEAPVVFNDGETGEHEYVLRSQFDRVGYVIFHEQPVSGVWPITAVRRGIMTEIEPGVMQTSVDISDLKVTYDDTQDENASHENTAPRMIFRGWSEAQVMPGEDTDVTGGVIRILSSPYTFRRTKDTAATPRHLFPVFVNINWLYFQTAPAGQGASYIPSRYYYADEGTNRFPVPLRTGYTFNGWWTGPDTNTAQRVSNNDGTLYMSANLSGWDGYIKDGNLMLNENVTVYGAWTPAPTKYTVVVWKQKSTDAANLAESAKTYDFAESFTNTALAEKSISVDQTYKNWSGQAANSVHESNYTGFTYARCDAAVTVKGDGTTVLNVYYDRNVHTLTFYTSAPTYTYRYNGNSSFTLGNSAADNNYTETLESNKRTIDGFEVSYRVNRGTYYYYFKRASESGSSWYQISGNSGQNVYNASSISVTTSGGTKVATVTGLYGASVKDAFPIVRESDGYAYTGKSWVGNRMYFQRLMAIELMPDVDIAFVQFSGSTYTGGTLEYYVETDATEDGAAYNATYGAYYKLYKTISHDFNYLTYKEDFHPLDGYTNNITHTDLNFTLQNGEYKTGSGITGTHRFYYERLPYMVSFTDSYTLDTLAEVPVEYLSPVSNGVPKKVTSTREGYNFTGWYADAACSTRAFFADDDTYRNYDKNKVLIERMPAHNLQLFAGWEAVWYLIKIDPNGGELAPGDSLWFWKNYGYTEIQEYTTATRSYEENVNGTWFYALPDRSYYGLTDEWEDREDENVDPEFAALISNRRAFYTTDQSTPGIRDVNKRYVQVQNAYRYAGWYEVKSDGSEELYAFGSPVQHNLHLRLHWKHLGTYRLHYEPGDGEMVERDENEETFKLLDSGVYADSSELLITRTAEPPDGYSFAGWRIRYGDGTVYHPGQSFVFNAAYAVNVPGPDGRPVKQLVLDAVYSQVRTVSLTTDANGGTIDPSVAVTMPLAYPNAPTLITNITDTARTVSGMRNNAYGHLSKGDGYTCTVKDDHGNDVTLHFLGWNTRADGMGTHFDPGQYVGVDTLDAPNGHNVLYAEWGVRVYFDKNRDTGVWRNDLWQAQAGTYSWDENEQKYYQETTLNGYATNPQIALESTAEDEMFRFWSTNRYSAVEDTAEFDFTQPIKGPITLYARWSNFVRVPFHVVDCSAATPALMDDAWLNPENHEFKIGNYTDISFANEPSQYLHDIPADREFAFTCVSAGPDSISDAAGCRIVRLYYSSAARATYVDYADGTSGPLPNDKEIYVVYYPNPKTIDIGYKEMEFDGGLADVALDNPASVLKSATISTNAYDVTSTLETPKGYLDDSTAYDYYAYALGETNATEGAQLRFITSAKSSDGDRPQLQIRNSWRGYEYSTDGGETWRHYGYDAQLYVVYFTAKPTIVNLTEQTLGTAADMTEQFEYVIAVTQIVTVVTNKQTRTLSTTEKDSYYTYWEGLSRKRHYYEHSYTIRYSNRDYTFYYDDDEWSAWSGTTYLGRHTTAEEISLATNRLANGGAESITLFSNVIDPGAWSDGGTVSTGSTSSSLKLTETRLKTVTTNAQMLVITQARKDGFTTTNDTGDGAYVYSQMSASAVSTRSVTFTNKRESLPVELHVAFAQSGAIDHVDNTWRTETEADYTLTVPLSVEGDFEDALEKTNVILRAAAADRRFLGAYYGTAVETDLADENKVSLVGPVTSVGFVKNPNADWYRLCLNGDANLALGDYKVYYVYGEIPTVRYMKEGANGALTEIATLTYVGNPVTMNGATVAQGTVLDVPAGGTPLTVGAGGMADFYVPLSLDGSAQASLNYYALAAGPADATATNAMNAVTWGTSLRVKVAENGLLKWSFDGETWGDFTGTAASIYAIYKEKGYDLTIAVDSLASDADKAKDVFTVTVASINLVVGNDYVVSGYAPDGTPIDTVKATACDAGGMLTFTVTSGVRFTIQSLPNNDWPRADGFGTEPKDYTLRELLPSSDYALTNLLVNGAVPLAQVQVENGTATYIDMDKTVAFTNVKRYDVSFVEEDGETKVLSAPYWYGTAVDAIATPDAPAKMMDSANLYRFKNWTPALESVQSNTVYTAAYKAIPIPQATQRAADTNIVVTLSEEEAQAREAALVEALKSAGVDITADDYSETDATEKLNARDPNGLRRWENLVTGTAFDQLLLNTVSGNSATISAKMVADPDASIKKDLGYTVLRELRKKGDGDAWRTVAGPFEAGNPSFDIALADGEGNSVNASGLYRLVTLIVPKCDLSITNEIPSTNIIGVLEVVSPHTNTVVAVPWKQLAKDPAIADDISVSNHVSTVNLSNGDSVYALKDDSSKDGSSDTTYEMWTLNNGKWDSVTTVSGAAAGASVMSVAEASDVKRFPRTKAVWVQRQNPLDASGATVPFFLVGQYESKDVTISVAGGTNSDPGYTLISVPDYRDYSINDLDWSGYAAVSSTEDSIRVVNGLNSFNLWWRSGAWCKEQQVASKRGGLRMDFVPYTEPLKAGTGFWLCRHGEAFTIKWKAKDGVQ